MFTFFHKKNPRPKKNIKLYTTRLPKNGWIFECMECSNRTGNMIIIKEYEVYICRSCLSKIKLDGRNKKNKKAYYKKLVELEDYYLKNNKL
jgi:DNA-directed RNA polymerase subunit RPC12/RpoP